MKKKPEKDISASVRARLLNLARATGRDFQELTVRYTVERFLSRLVESEHRERFILKGALNEVQKNCRLRHGFRRKVGLLNRKFLQIKTGSARIGFSQMGSSCSQGASLMWRKFGLYWHKPGEIHS